MDAEVTAAEVEELPSRLRRKQEERLEFVRAVYIATDGRTDHPVSIEDVSRRIGLDPMLTEPVVEYLTGEQLLVASKANGNGKVALTHRGVLEVEQAIHSPGQDTEHFPSVVVQQVFNAPVSSVKVSNQAKARIGQAPNTEAPSTPREAHNRGNEPIQATCERRTQVNSNKIKGGIVFNGPVGSSQVGDHTTAYVSQNIGIAGDTLSELVRLLNEIRSNLTDGVLPDENRVEALRLVDGLEEQAQSSTPNTTVIKTCGYALHQVLAQGPELLALANSLKVIVDTIAKCQGL